MNTGKKIINTITWAALAASGLLLILGGCGAREGGTGGVGRETLKDEAEPTEEKPEGGDADGEAADLNGADEEMETGTAVEDGRFDSWGVFIQILAEDDVTLSEADRADFLETFGFRDSEPFYVHTDEDGYPFMELYYDDEREIGCGIRYEENNFGNVICGFAFNSCQEISWHQPDPFSVLSVDGTTGEDSVTDYQENYEYDEAGRALHFESAGKPKDVEGGDEEKIPIIKVDFTYDDQGRLQKKEYAHFTSQYLPFGTTCSSQVSHYDERQRLTHTSSYITHGSLEGYYIYQGDSDVPAYYLELDHQYTSWPTFYRFSEKNNNWEFGGYRWDPNAQYLTYEIEPGEEEEFLVSQGYSEENLFYEYEYGSEWDPSTTFRLFLYCDEALTRGLGYIKKYKDGQYVAENPNLLIFTFDGNERYLHNAVGPFSVYSYYSTSGRYVSFLQGETVDEYFHELEPEFYGVSFDYDEDGKLLHVYTGVTHGGVYMFYIYKNGWGDTKTSMPYYMLEVDPGWGVTFYRFDSF